VDQEHELLSGSEKQLQNGVVHMSLHAVRGMETGMENQFRNTQGKIKRGGFAFKYKTKFSPGALPCHRPAAVEASYTPRLAELQVEGGNVGLNVGSAATPPSTNRLFTPSGAAGSCGAARRGFQCIDIRAALQNKVTCNTFAYRRRAW